MGDNSSLSPLSQIDHIPVAIVKLPQNVYVIETSNAFATLAWVCLPVVVWLHCSVVTVFEEYI